MMDCNIFKKIMDENEERLPLLTLDEFFEGNTAEDSIAPSQCDFGRRHWPGYGICCKKLKE